MISLEEKKVIIENLYNKLVIDSNLAQLVGEAMTKEYVIETNNLIDGIARKYLLIDSPDQDDGIETNIEDLEDTPEEQKQEQERPRPVTKLQMKESLRKEIDEL